MFVDLTQDILCLAKLFMEKIFQKIVCPKEFVNIIGLFYLLPKNGLF